jgi:DNA repair photolyase
MSLFIWRKTEIRRDDGQIVEGVAPVIISASRSTDIPAFFSTWMVNRLRQGYVRWLNPFNRTPQYVSFHDTRVIVFWSKNPKPLIRYLPEIDAKGINYYFQFTLNDYHSESLEPNVPPLQQRVDTFKALSERLGKNRVVWRYDPLILTESLTVEALLDRIDRVASMLRGCTEKLVISFADISVYKKVQNNLAREQVPYREFTPELMLELAEGLSERNRQWGLKVATCAEGIDLERFGIAHNRCIDDALLIELFRDDTALMEFLGYEPDLFADSSRPYLKDKGQRKECGCIVSKDIGMYDTCHNLCTYCYANTSCKAVENNLRRHDPHEESLVSDRALPNR